MVQHVRKLLHTTLYNMYGMQSACKPGECEWQQRCWLRNPQLSAQHYCCCQHHTCFVLAKYYSLLCQTTDKASFTAKQVKCPAETMLLTHKIFMYSTSRCTHALIYAYLGQLRLMRQIALHRCPKLHCLRIGPIEENVCRDPLHGWYGHGQ